MAQKSLDDAMQNPAGWKLGELTKLYTEYGFKISEGKRHRKVQHTQYPDVLTILPRATKVKVCYVRKAAKLIQKVLKRDKGI